MLSLVWANEWALVKNLFIIVLKKKTKTKTKTRQQLRLRDRCIGILLRFEKSAALPSYKQRKRGHLLRFVIS